MALEIRSAGETLDISGEIDCVGEVAVSCKTRGQQNDLGSVANVATAPSVLLLLIPASRLLFRLVLTALATGGSGLSLQRIGFECELLGDSISGFDPNFAQRRCCRALGVDDGVPIELPRGSRNSFRGLREQSPGFSDGFVVELLHMLSLLLDSRPKLFNENPRSTQAAVQSPGLG